MPVEGSVSMKKKILVVSAGLIFLAPVIFFLTYKSATVKIGTFAFWGGYTPIDLIAATTNALNGALLARRPDHYKNYTIVGIMLFAVLGGIGGGVTRDILVAQVPAALTNPAYILLCLIAGVVGYFVAYGGGQIFREGLFQFMTAFSLPWYAIVGVQTGLVAGFPLMGCVLLGVVGATAGRYLIDVSCGVPPKQLVQGEWFVVIAIITGTVWLVCDSLGLPQFLATLIAFGVGFAFRLLALYHAYEEPLAKEPAAAYLPDEGRPKLGRKLKGESERELKEIQVDKNDTQKKE